MRIPRCPATVRGTKATRSRKAQGVRRKEGKRKSLSLEPFTLSRAGSGHWTLSGKAWRVEGPEPGDRNLRENFKSFEGKEKKWKKGRWGLVFFIGRTFWLIRPGPGAEVELGQVVVTATKTEIEISESPQAIAVITKEEIQNSPDRSRRLIQRTPGTLVTKYGSIGSFSLPQIRGAKRRAGSDPGGRQAGQRRPERPVRPERLPLPGKKSRGSKSCGAARPPFTGPTPWGG